MPFYEYIKSFEPSQPLMRRSSSCFFIFFLFFCFAQISTAQEKAILRLDTTSFSADQQINLAAANEWLFHPGHNPAWSGPTLNTTGWQKLKLIDFSMKYADETGRAEGWFRLRIRLAPDFASIPVFFRKSGWAATDLYLDGRLVASYGSTGGAKPYQQYFFFNKLPVRADLKPGREHVVALHIVDYPSPINPGRLKSEIGIDPRTSFRLVGVRYQSLMAKTSPVLPLITLFRLTVTLVVSILLWLLFWQPLGNKEKGMIRLLATQSSLLTLNAIAAFANLQVDSWGSFTGVLGIALGYLVDFLAVSTLFAIQLRMVDHPWSGRAILPLLLTPIAAFVLDQLGVVYPLSLSNLVFAMLVIAMLYVLIAYRKRLHGAQWVIAIGLMLSLTVAIITVIGGFLVVSTQISLAAPLLSLAYMSTIPLSFLVYLAFRFKEILIEVRTHASAVIQVTEEKRELLATQNQLLENQVEIRTAELKASQAQLVQKEKLASLGELTAGIAHEIQNPLNFVNNFSEVSSELIDELKEGPFQKLPESEKEYAGEILVDLAENLQKINHHGGRASSIVKSMLEHSRTGTSEREPTDLNTLADEYLRLAYHGQSSKSKEFDCKLVTDFDPNLGEINVVPQEIGRVLLNLYNNAFYAVKEKGALGKGQRLEYQPTVWVSTKQLDKQIEIRVRDNGTGIPESVKAKIFQPFFTTKPTGEGTGLGLSLSYDIVTKGHGGSLNVNNIEGDGTVFVITLPV